MHLQHILVGVLAASAPASAQLDKWAKAAGLKYFGTAVDNPALGNQAYMKIARDADEFGAITPANGQKWSLTEPNQGSFNYGSGDAVTSFAKQSGQLLRCHTLVWYNQLPGWGACGPQISRDGAAWFSRLTRSLYILTVNGARAQMEKIITTHIQNVVTHIKGSAMRGTSSTRPWKMTGRTDRTHVRRFYLCVARKSGC